MNKLFSIFTIFIFTITLQANTLIDEILNEFAIPNNEKNKEIRNHPEKYGISHEMKNHLAYRFSIL